MKVEHREQPAVDQARPGYGPDWRSPFEKDELGELSHQFEAAHPFPHAVFDGLFDPELLRCVIAESLSAGGGVSDRRERWTTWDTENELKHVLSDPTLFGPAASTLTAQLNGVPFLRFLEALTGIEGLICDPWMDAAGYFDVPEGGFLELHHDFARHVRLGLDRRINVLVYLNPGWQRSWGGELVLAEHLDGEPVVEVVPAFNRTVVFLTPGAVHGHPTPVLAPDGRHRLCFSTYYFTSPARPDSPRLLHNVLFARQGTARMQWVPPALIDLIARRRALRVSTRARRR